MARRPGRGVQALRDGPRVPAAPHAALARDRRRACSSRTATSSSTARRPRPRRRRRTTAPAARGRARGGLARDRQPAGGGAVSHLLREHAPITDAGWERDRRRGPRAADAGPRPRASSSTSPGPLGWEHSATNLGRVEPLARRAGRGRRGAPAARAAARRAARAVHRRARRAARPRPRRGRRRPRRRSTTPRSGSRSPRTSPSSTAGERPGSTASPRPRRTRRSPLGDDGCDRYPTHVARAVEMLLLGRRSTGPYGLALGPERLHRRRRDHRARRLPAARPPAQDPRRPDRVGARASTGAVVVSLRGGDFLFESGQDLSVGYEPPRRRRRAPLPGGELQLPGRDAGGRGRADDVSRTRPGAAGPPRTDHRPARRRRRRRGAASCATGARTSRSASPTATTTTSSSGSRPARATTASTASGSPPVPGRSCSSAAGQVHVFEEARGLDATVIRFRDEVVLEGAPRLAARGTRRARRAGHGWGRRAAGHARRDAAGGARAPRRRAQRGDRAPPRLRRAAVVRALVRRDAHRGARGRRRGRSSCTAASPGCWRPTSPPTTTRATTPTRSACRPPRSRAR